MFSKISIYSIMADNASMKDETDERNLGLWFEVFPVSTC